MTKTTSPEGFQSTLSSRRATYRETVSSRSNADFNPRSPHGERRYEPGSLPLEIGFQSTLSSRRATDDDWSKEEGWWEFQSTLSSRRATQPPCRMRLLVLISIHALLTESDGRGILCCLELCIISIHALLTESDRCRGQSALYRYDFNPRSPHGERPANTVLHLTTRRDFNPRSPHGERPPAPSTWIVLLIFQSTLSSRRATFSPGWRTA